MAANSFLLRTFGGLHLERADGQRVPGDALQRRLLLVALAADAGDRGVSRDRVIGLLWPESDEEHGRRSLNQLRYTLRRELGGADLVVGTNTLRVDPAQLHTDMADFRAAIARGDADAAAAIQFAPFLDGVFAEGAPELDQWVEDRRREFRAALEDVLLRAARSPGSGPDAAVSRWRRLIELDPLNAVYAVGAMEALAGNGDATGALVVAGRHEAAVLRELGVPPDRAVAEAAARIREHTRPVRTRSGKPTAEVEPLPEVVQSAPAQRPARRRWAPVAVGAVAVAALAMAAVRMTRDPVDDAPPRVVIALDAPDGAAPSPEREAARLLGPALHRGAGSLELPVARVRAALVRMRQTATSVLDGDMARELAVREGLPWIVVARAVASGERMVLRYQIEESGSGRVVRSREENAPSATDLPGAVDRLADRLADDLAEVGPGPALTPMPRVTTVSLEALRAYAGSVRLASAGDRSQHDLAERAVMLDSNFAAAHARLAYNYWFAYDLQRAERHAAQAERSLAGLDPIERLWITREIANAREDWPTAIAGARALLERDRRNASSWHALAQLLYFDGQYARSVEAYDSAMMHAEAEDSLTLLINHATVLARQGRFEASAARYRQAFALDSLLLDDPFIYLEYGGVLLQLGRPAEARTVFQRPVSGRARDRAGALRALALLDAFEGRYRRATELLDESATASSADADTLGNAVAHLLTAEIRLLSGDTVAARSELGAFAGLARRAALPYEVVSRAIKLAARARSPRLAAELLGRMETQLRSRSSAAKARLLLARGEVHLASGRVVEGRRALEQAYALERTDDLLESTAYAAQAAGLASLAAVRYDTLAAGEGLDWDGYAIRGLGRYQAGRAWDLAGDSARGASAYRALVTAWREGDDDLAPLAEARSRVPAGVR